MLIQTPNTKHAIQRSLLHYSSWYSYFTIHPLIRTSFFFLAMYQKFQHNVSSTRAHVKIDMLNTGRLTNRGCSSFLCTTHEMGKRFVFA